MNHSLEPPRLLADEATDPIVRRLLRSSQEDGPTPKQLVLAPAAVAALLGAQTLTQTTVAGAIVGSTKVPLIASGVGAPTQTTVAGTIVGSAKVPLVASGVSATAAGATGLASVTSSLSALPALAKSILLGLALGGALVATVPEAATSMRTGKPPQPRSPIGLASAPAAHVAERAAYSAPRMPNSPEPEKPVAAVSVRPSRFAPPPRPLPRATDAAVLNADLDASRLPNAHDIAREVALLDSARSALGRNEPARSLVELDRYQSLSRRTLDPEATVLRVRALLAAGRRQDAEGIARAFIGRAPNAPQAQLLRKLTGIESFTDPN